MIDEINIIVERIKDKINYLKFRSLSNKIERDRKKSFKKNHGCSENTFDILYELFKKW